jgi:lysyl-tRNA synthetase class 1
MVVSKEMLSDFPKKAWPFIEAQRILQNINNTVPKKGYVLFSAGYSPSGFPHIGTFGEIFRIYMVMNAFKMLSDIPIKLMCFSDDMDGLKKVPENIINREEILKYVEQPLSKIPDPFGQASSFAEYMNNQMCAFLDRFNLEYEFFSATECYNSGLFDDMLIKCLHKYDDIMDVMLPSLRDDRRSTYSPFMPICPKTGKVLQVKIVKLNKEKNTISYIDLDGELVETEVTGGKCKLQWKPDFAMRWAKLEVDYEIYGKDHMENAHIYSSLCKVFGKEPPVQYFYEMFLGADGAKISKSKGNGLSLEDWLKYGPIESMSLFMFQSPGRAKRLFFDVIPKTVDEYITYVTKYHTTDEDKINNPVFLIHNGSVPKINMYNIDFNLLLNLASVSNPESTDVLWKFIKQYAPEAHKEKDQFLYSLAKHAVLYYNDFVKNTCAFKVPSEQDKIILSKIISVLEALSTNISSSQVQTEIYTIGRESGFESLKDFFKLLYQILLGQDQGPRLGSFFHLYGIKESITLIKSKMNA